ncbi:hypothetical protein THAOC_30534, partial [Thalassiosira oceanica]
MNYPPRALRFLVILAATIAAVQPDDRSALAPERQPAAAAQQAVEMTARGGKLGVLQFDDEQEQQHGRMAKAKKPKSGKRPKKEHHGNIFDGDGRSVDKCDIEDFISDATYDNGGTCDKTFKVKIDCNDGRDLCTFEEES